MSKVRFYIAMAAAKTAHRLLRLCGRAATHTPGAVATKLCPDFLRYLQKPETLICVTGTDGKTTVSNLLATVLQNNGYTVTNNSYGEYLRGCCFCAADGRNVFGQTEKAGRRA